MADGEGGARRWISSLVDFGWPLGLIVGYLLTHDMGDSVGGEVLAHVRKHVLQGRPLDRDALTLELGDALWCLAIAADTLGVSLQVVAQRNVEKLRARHP